MSQKTYEERLKEWQDAQFASPPQPDTTPATPSLIEMAPLRDGVRLYTEVYLPAPNGRFPVVLTRSPYPYSRPSRNDKRPVSRYLQAGYAVVYQLTRGQYLSEGVYHFNRDDVEDGFDCVNWVADQVWCNGHIGMEGPSYLGATQLSAARAKPKALKCIMPTAFVGNFASVYPFLGGVPVREWFLHLNRLMDAESMADLNPAANHINILRHPVWGPALHRRPLLDAADGILQGDKLASWREVMSHPLDDEYWRPIHFTDRQLAELELPIFFTDGWYDPTIGPIDYYQRLQDMQPQRNDIYLLVGPWNHSQTYADFIHDQDNGDRKMAASGAVDLVAQRLAFFDRYLKGDTDSVIQTDRVRVYITGIDQWRDFPTFPAPATQWHRLYLHSNGDARSFPGDGSLSWQPPRGEKADCYVYDPGLPTPSEVEPLRDRRSIEVRSDVLTYTSEPLRHPLTILGEIKLVLYAASDATDTDWFAHLTEIFPDGRSVAFHAIVPALRARYRQGFDREVALTPNEPTQFSMSLGPAGHQLAVGHRLRLSISSAAFPMCDPNTNTGKPAATDTEMRIARQTIFHDTERATHLLIPLLDEV